MSSPAAPLRPLSAAQAIRLLRCARHPEREAAAKCPACQQPFCRECVSEHEGRLLCAACLAKVAAAEASHRRKRDLAPLRRRLATAVSFLALWFLAHLLATTLARIPVNMHDSTVWEVEEP